jgi:glycosyltransferase involved in cell wall biosynthesis
MNISIIICTCNRCERLRRTLESLEEMITPQEVHWEVIVVDNNSMDDTKGVTNAFAKANPGSFKYVFEERQGKSFALNTGVRYAQGEIVAFTDDDCIVSSNWIGSIVREFEADPRLTGIGGMVKLYNKHDKPVAIRLAKSRATVSGSNFDPGFIPIIGANMAFKRIACNAIGGFDTDLGPGCKTKSAEDVDFLYRICINDFKVVYVPEVLVYHNHGRSEDFKVAAAKEEYAVGRGAFYYKYIRARDRRVLKMAYREIYPTIKELIAGKSIRAHKTRLRALMRGAVYMMGCRKNAAV